jgi:uncharacterized MnhB-related membrane protein
MSDKTIIAIGFICVLAVFPAILFIFGSDALVNVIVFGVIAIALGLWLMKRFHITIYEGRFRRY